MITHTKLKEYMWANGDIDGYARSRRDGDISDKEWFAIDRIVSAITIIERGLASQEFREKHDAEVVRLFDRKSTYQGLVEFSKKERTR